MKTLVTLIALAALSACTNSEVLATCKGPIFALNTGHWQPTKADLQPPAAGKTR
jgi:type IV secretion system protein VirB7